MPNDEPVDDASWAELVDELTTDEPAHYASEEPTEPSWGFDDPQAL